MNSSDPSVPDKGYLYGVYQGAADWRDRLARKCSFKSLDIADDDDMRIDARKQGITWKEILAGAGLAGAIAWGVSLFSEAPAPPPPADYVDTDTTRTLTIEPFTPPAIPEPEPPP
jgi:hypothetical protein